jgi:two-component system NarL family response regulator
MKHPRLRILIVDDHFMIRMGVVSALARERDIEVVGEARTGREALALFEKLRPDVTLMDGRLPDIHGVEVTRRIVAAHPCARILMVSIDDTAEDIHRALEAGATGCLAKASEKNDMVAAIRTVAAGERCLSAEFAQKLANRNRFVPLSERELEVLRLVARGQTNKAIAGQLGMGDATVKTHLSHALSKLGAQDRTQAVTLAIERGFLKL